MSTIFEHLVLRISGPLRLGKMLFLFAFLAIANAADMQNGGLSKEPASDQSNSTMQMFAALARNQAVVLPRQEVKGWQTTRYDHKQTVSENVCQWMACAMCMLIAASIVVIYMPFGLHVVIIIGCYMVSIVAIRLQLKDIYTRLNFTFPLTLTIVHLLVSGAAANVVFQLKHADESVTFYKRRRKVCIIAICVGASILLNNVSLVHIGAALNAMIAASGCIVQIAILSFRGLYFPRQCLLAVILACAGVSLGLSAKASHSIPEEFMALMVGCFSAALSTIARCLRGVCQQVMLDPASISCAEADAFKRVHPLQMVSWTCPLAGMMLIPVAYYFEGTAPISFVSLGEEGLVPALLASCATAAFVNIGSQYATKALGATGALNVGQLCLVVTILLAVPLQHEVLTRQMWIGTVMTICGSYWFESMRKEVRNADGLATYGSVQTANTMQKTQTWLP